MRFAATRFTAKKSKGARKRGGQLAEMVSPQRCPNALGVATDGNRRRASVLSGHGNTFTAKACGRSQIHAALDRLLLRPTETSAGDPGHCRMMDDSPNDPGVTNAWASSDARGGHEDRPHRGA